MSSTFLIFSTFLPHIVTAGYGRPPYPMGSPFDAFPASLNNHHHRCADVDVNKNGTTKICNVLNFGAIGDGDHDDSSAVLKAVAECLNDVVYFPSGQFKISQTISIPTGGPFSIQGDGWGSNILWSQDTDLFAFPESVAAIHV
jgi:hypothetical protein